MRLLPSRAFFPWLVLAAICAVYAGTVWRLHPTNFFGLTEDDSIYFSSARALAEGRGYILPSVPGTPPATKYPILYPWLLSWVWRWNPSFPDNLRSAVALNLVFGCAFLTMAFLFLRRFGSLGDAAALTITAFCALNPLVLLYSGDLMSDIPFAALTLAAIVLTSRILQANAGPTGVVCCGILSGVAILIRALGIPVAAGLGVAIAWRSGWRKTALFAACVFPFAAYVVSPLLASSRNILFMDSSKCSVSWQMTWLYYTSYSGFWRADTISNHLFLPVLHAIGSNLSLCLLEPGAYFLDRTVIRPAVLGMALVVILSAVAIRGAIRHGQVSGVQPIHLVLTFYLMPLLVWDYGSVDRFLIPFLPLMVAALWLEARYLTNQIRIFLKEKDRNRIAATLACLAGAVLVLSVPVSWWRSMHLLARESNLRGTLLGEKREAYGWLRENTPPDARFIAYEDGLAFLYSARQGMRPTIFSPAGVYRAEVLDGNLSCINSSAEPIGARYWVFSDDDFGFEWEPAGSRGKVRARELESSLPLLFRSAHGSVRIYGIASRGQPPI